jgi:hypothetical protein
MDLGNIGLSMLVPFIVSFAKQSGFDDRVNRIIAIWVYAVWAALVTLSTAGAASPAEFLNNFAVTITVGSATYNLILKQFGIDDKLTEATTPSRWKPPVEDEVEVGDEPAD